MNLVCEIEHVTKRYGNNTVFDKICFDVVQGDIIAITGESGSGKTTLLNIIGMLENPNEGIVKLFGEERPSIRSRKANILLRTKISFLFQNYALIEQATLNENLTIPLTYVRKSKKEKRELKVQALREVGLNLSLKQKIHELSGGEQQRVAMARLLLKPCELILADEPTGSLDERNRDDILQILNKLNQKGKTIIIVTHDPVVKEICNREIRLSK
ncbi:ABC transporter ATP-binding protein [Mechercharimyces sp. CAU 1602]|uniref:ABC transporter ATP-binding protein n=1 Tax=Mechercharimyces sp. CAU 1602 TaxID=2973933 RepID=UPI002162EE5C|nr:ABC transporter ATP-binding protein [Mechercharimyces sp. CAU 1602]MCS1351955.1 ABC transporter ATP-binding protein [Mechercharimyces sp. CAU 1602]